MFCKNCGTEISENERFCSFCGKEIPENAIANKGNVKVIKNVPPASAATNNGVGSSGVAQTVKTNPKTSEPSPIAKEPTNKPSVKPQQKAVKQKGTGKAKAIVASLLLVILVIVGAVIAINKAHTINFSKYIYDELQISGYDGYGEINENSILDWESFLNDIGRTSYEAANQYGSVDECFYVNFDSPDSPNERLSNGDIVEVRIAVNYKKFNSYDFDKTLKGDKEYTLKYEVKGLTEQTTVDPFKAVESVDFKFDKYTINYNESYSENIGEYKLYFRKNGDYNYLIIKNTSGDSIGDVEYRVYGTDDEKKSKVTTSCSTDRYADKGIVFAEEEKIYNTNIWEEIESGSELSSENVKFLKDRALSYAKSNVSDDWTNVNVGDAFYFNVSSGYYSYVDNCVRVFFKYKVDGEERCFHIDMYNIVKYKDGVDFKDFHKGMFGMTAINEDSDSYNEVVKSYKEDDGYYELNG